MRNILKSLPILLILTPLVGITAALIIGPWTGIMIMLVMVTEVRWRNLHLGPGNEELGQAQITPQVSEVHQLLEAVNFDPEHQPDPLPVVETRIQVDHAELIELADQHAETPEKTPPHLRAPWPQQPASFAVSRHNRRKGTQQQS